MEYLLSEHRVDDEPVARWQIARESQPLEDGTDLAVVGPSLGDDGRVTPLASPVRPCTHAHCVAPARKFSYSRGQWSTDSIPSQRSSDSPTGSWR